jgi:hypothetical protein
MRIDVGGGARVEGHRLGSLESLLIALRSPGLDRVDPVVAHHATFGRSFACLGEGYRMDGSQAHLSRAAVEHEAKDPRLGPAGAHLEIQATSVVVHPLLADTLYLDRGEPVRRASHDLILTSLTT